MPWWSALILRPHRQSAKPTGMETTIGSTKIRLVRGDITDQDVDGIVNAANNTLMGGGGVDGAIHRRGGPEILAECKALVAQSGQLPTGLAVVTTGGNLPARRVIHTVGPVYKGGYDGENTKLERAYQSSLQLAVDEGLRTLAFPSISTGAYRFPIDEASLVALNTMVRFCRENPDALDEIRVVLFSAEDMSAYETRFDELVQTMLG